MVEQAEQNDQIIKHHRLNAVMFYAIIVISVGLIGSGLFLGLRFLKNNTNLSNNIPGELPTSAQTSNIQPLEISMPSIKINAPVTETGLNGDGSLEVPSSTSNKVGWYKYGAVPGQYGPSVLVGHLDTTNGPAILWNLKNIKSGDQVSIALNDNTTAIYKVNSIESYSQNNFPTDKVYGAINYPGLRIITCSGTYNILKQRYSENLVVYATLLKTVKGSSLASSAN